MPRIDGQQLGHEGDAHGPAGGEGRLLLHLGDVAVVRDLVRLHVLVELGEEVLVLEAAPRARDAGLGVDDHRARLDQVRAQERKQRQQDRGHVAAGGGHEPGAAQRVAVELGDAEDGLTEQLRRLVGAVPLLVDGEVAEAEVGGEVDHREAGLAQRRHRRRGGAVVQAGEDRVDPPGEALGIERLVAERAEPAERGERLAQRAAGALLGGDDRELEARVAEHDAQQLEPGVAARPEHRDAQSVGAHDGAS